MFFARRDPDRRFAFALFYLFVIGALVLPADDQGPDRARAWRSSASYLPNMFISNLVQKRQKAIKIVFPDALDMLLICVQSGMSVEAAFGQVAQGDRRASRSSWPRR